MATLRRRWITAAARCSNTLVWDPALPKIVVGPDVASSKRCLSSEREEQERPLQKEQGDISSYLETEAQIDTSLHGGMLKALNSVYGNNVTVDHLKSFGLVGLKALAESVEQQERKRGGKPGKRRPSRKVTFTIPHHQTSFELEWKEGDSLLDVARDNEELLGEYMEGTCGGQMSCCTCHVYLNDTAVACLVPPVRAEKDMLDLAYEPIMDNNISRLGCQVKLRKELLQMKEPIVVTIPAGVHNVWK